MSKLYNKNNKSKSRSRRGSMAEQTEEEKSWDSISEISGKMENLLHENTVGMNTTLLAR